MASRPPGGTSTFGARISDPPGAAAPPAPPAESRREQDSPAPPAESRSEKDSPAGLTLHRGDKRGTFPESHFQRFCFTCSNHPDAQYGPFPFPALCSGSQCRFLRGPFMITCDPHAPTLLVVWEGLSWFEILSSLFFHHCLCLRTETFLQYLQEGPKECIKIKSYSS